MLIEINDEIWKRVKHHAVNRDLTFSKSVEDLVVKALKGEEQ